MSIRIYTTMNRDQVRDQVLLMVKSCTGSAADHAEHAKTVHTTIGLAALADIKSDFIRKSRGGVGEDGVKWPPLSKEYLAYQRRFGPTEKADLKKAAGLNRNNRNRGLLTVAQNKRWKAIFRSTYLRLAVSIPDGEAKSKAAQIAWAVLKREGAKTMLEVFGNRQVEILRDTGVLLNSLSPVDWAGSGPYNPPEDQIFELATNGVAVGTNVKYASAHQNGTKAKSGKTGIPARPFLPKDRVPSVWSRDWAAAGLRAIHLSLVAIFQRGKAA